MTGPADSKTALWQQLIERLTAEFEALRHAQQETQKGATHEEAKPENDKDTRALEQSYLARGQAVRTAELARGLAAVISFPLRSFDPATPIALGALVTLEAEEGAPFRVLLAPAGAGERLQHTAGEVRVITSASPLGRAIVGCRADDAAEYFGPNGKTSVTILDLE